MSHSFADRPLKWLMLIVALIKFLFWQFQILKWHFFSNSHCGCALRGLWITSQHVLQSRETGDPWLTCGQSTSLLAEKSWPRMNFSHSVDVNNREKMSALCTRAILFREYSSACHEESGWWQVDNSFKSHSVAYNLYLNQTICARPAVSGWWKWLMKKGWGGLME